MEKVYIVLKCDLYEGCEVLKVYDTEAKANECANAGNRIALEGEDFRVEAFSVE